MSQWMANRLVKRGARLWDEKLPDWYEQIDISSLEMSDGCSCIIGQIAGRRENLDRLWHGVRKPSDVGYTALAARIFKKRSFDTYEQEVLHGFNAAGAWEGGLGVLSSVHYAGRRVRVTYEELQQAWVAEIMDRREKVAM